MSKAEEIKIRLVALTTFIEEAQAKLAQGEIIDLSHLDGDVANLCEEALQLPAAETKSIQPAMAAMIGKLEELSVALKDFQTHLKDRAENMKKEKE